MLDAHAIARQKATAEVPVGTHSAVHETSPAQGQVALRSMGPLMDRLPPDTLAGIMCLLAYEDLGNLKLTCQGMWRAAKDGTVWRNLLHRQFPCSQLTASSAADWEYTYNLQVRCLELHMLLGCTAWVVLHQANMSLAVLNVQLAKFHGVVTMFACDLQSTHSLTQQMKHFSKPCQRPSLLLQATAAIEDLQCFFTKVPFTEGHPWSTPDLHQEPQDQDGRPHIGRHGPCQPGCSAIYGR